MSAQVRAGSAQVPALPLVSTPLPAQHHISAPGQSRQGGGWGERRLTTSRPHPWRQHPKDPTVIASATLDKKPERQIPPLFP